MGDGVSDALGSSVEQYTSAEVVARLLVARHIDFVIDHIREFPEHFKAEVYMDYGIELDDSDLEDVIRELKSLRPRLPDYITLSLRKRKTRVRG